MKIFSTFKLPKAMMGFLLCTLFLGCRHKENIYPEIDCTPKVEKFASLKGASYDSNSNSPFFNDIVVLSTYEQTTTSYPSPTCGKNTASTSVRLWNQTNKKISFKYYLRAIEYRSNQIHWEYHSSASINANSFIDIREVSKNLFSLASTSGVLICVLDNITYQ